MLKFNAKVGEWGPGLRFKSRIFRICLYLIKTGHQPGVYVPLRALFLVANTFVTHYKFSKLIRKISHTPNLFKFVY